MSKHPTEGFLFPENVNEDEIIPVAGKYIGECSFTLCSPVKPGFGSAFSEKNAVDGEG